MTAIDIYPEILRATHHELVEALVDAGVAEQPAADVALQVVEWIRGNWGGRTLTRIWWGFPTGKQTPDAETSAELLPVASDPVKSFRGREVRTVAWSILVQQPAPLAGVCRLASLIALTVERCLALIGGGGSYIPKAAEVDRAQRDQDVWSRFHWLGNIDQVIARTGLAQSQLYAIKRRVQKERDAREQPSLFDPT